MAAEGKSGALAEAEALSTASLWKGENDSDAEQMEAYDSNPLGNAGAWTEKEACAIYREKLLALRSLYTSQLARLKHSLAERRRQFLLEWAAAGGDREEAVNPSHGGSLEDAAYRSYRRRTGEEAVLERRQKQRQIAASIEFFSRKEMRSSSRGHHQHLVRLQGQYMPTPHPVCNNLNCENKCLPFSMKCRRHICSDPKQLLYTSCTYVYPSGGQCGSPIPLYLSPPLCGGHCDTALSSPPPPPPPPPGTNEDEKTQGATETAVGNAKEIVTTPGDGEGSCSAIEKAVCGGGVSGDGGSGARSVARESPPVEVGVGQVKAEDGQEELMEVVGKETAEDDGRKNQED